MCIAGLHVSTQPCAHRWYQLVRSCNPDINLRNCPEKLKLEGWEARTIDCPWCDPDNIFLHESTHRLLGNMSSGSSTPSSPTLSDMGCNTPQRTDSFGSIGLSALSRQSSATSMESERGNRNRDMNDRLHTYLNSHPHEVLPSAAKNYPTYPRWQSLQSPDASQTDSSVLRRHSRVFSAQWRRKMRSSLGFVRNLTTTDVSGAHV